MKAIVAHEMKDLRIEDHVMPEVRGGELRIKVCRGGICGSDLHYYNHGGFGTVRLKEPMVLGHEVSGTIEAMGPAVDGAALGLALGDLVAVSPSRPCYRCAFCLSGQQNHCENMRFYGSAMPFPHIQGAFCEYVTVDPRQCAKADGLTAGEAAVAEPLAVVLHAARRAGDLMGKRVLVTGCGPIGMLAILVARAAGAVEIVATDVTGFTLDMARKIGADRAHNVASDAAALEAYAANKGHFDVLFECSGAAQALRAAVGAMRPGAVVMQLGLGGDMTLPVQAMTAKELELRGSFRFHSEFFAAVDLMKARRIDVKPLITHTFPVSDAIPAFEMAADRSQAIKAQIAFD